MKSHLRQKEYLSGATATVPTSWH